MQKYKLTLYTARSLDYQLSLWLFFEAISLVWRFRSWPAHQLRNVLALEGLTGATSVCSAAGGCDPQRLCQLQFHWRAVRFAIANMFIIVLCFRQSNDFVDLKPAGLTGRYVDASFNVDTDELRDLFLLQIRQRQGEQFDSLTTTRATTALGDGQSTNARQSTNSHALDTTQQSASGHLHAPHTSATPLQLSALILIAAALTQLLWQ